MNYSLGDVHFIKYIIKQSFKNHITSLVTAMHVAGCSVVNWFIKGVSYFHKFYLRLQMLKEWPFYFPSWLASWNTTANFKCIQLETNKVNENSWIQNWHYIIWKQKQKKKSLAPATCISQIPKVICDQGKLT